MLPVIEKVPSALVFALAKATSCVSGWHRSQVAPACIGPSFAPSAMLGMYTLARGTGSKPVMRAVTTLPEIVVRLASEQVGTWLQSGHGVLHTPGLRAPHI
jgi:hypothetical protein